MQQVQQSNSHRKDRGIQENGRASRSAMMGVANEVVAEDDEVGEDVCSCPGRLH